MTRITPLPPPMADTLLTGGQYRTPPEGKQMFHANTFESNLTKFISAVALAAFLASLAA